MIQIEPAQAFAIVSASRMPGFHYMLKVLDNLALQVKDRAFDSADDSSAVRLIHEGRGAAKLVREFKSAIETIERTVVAGLATEGTNA